MKSRLSNVQTADPELVAANWILRRDAGLTAGEEAELQAWLATDPCHAAALARKAQAWSALGRPLHRGQAGVLVERLEARKARRRRNVGLGAAAAAILLTAAAVLLPSAGNPSAPLDGPNVIRLSETRSLPDGSAVELRTGARMEVDFAGPLRRVWLRAGTAYFTVAKNEARPFVVAAGDVTFRAIGTAFAVEVGSKQVDVLVTEGRVAVEKPAANESASTLGAGRSGPDSAARNHPTANEPGDRGGTQPIATVGAGNRLVVDRIAGVPDGPAPLPIAVTQHEIDRRLAWRVPRLEFSELPLAQAVAVMNRYNRVQFEIPDAAVARLRISGVFRADNIETFVRLLEGTCGLEARRDGDTISLRNPGR